MIHRIEEIRKAQEKELTDKDKEIDEYKGRLKSLGKK